MRSALLTLGLCIAVFLHLWVGSTATAGAVLGAFTAFDPDNYNHYVILYQRLPRVLIAMHVGAVLACAGAVFQGLVRNPLASPTTLGVSGGAMVAVIIAAATGLSASIQGIAALAGGLLGAFASFRVARLTGLAKDPRGMLLILAGALVTMLCVGTANAILLTDPGLRQSYLGWLSGDINHVYAERLRRFWWIGWLCVAAMMAYAKPMTLIMFGAEKAASTGVNVRQVNRIGYTAATLAAASATAICGPIAFIGVVVPHLIRPFTGPALGALIPASAMTGALICLLADLIAREAFSPYVLHSGVVMDFAGGIVFIALIRRHYLGARI